jgi:type IX secretion system PorP/SprF family membrane protein
VSEKIYVSAGAAATLENTRLSGDDLYFGENPDPDPFVDKLKNGSTNHSELWTRVGLLVYGEKFYIGGAYYPYNATVTTSDVAFTDPFYKGNLQAGVSFRLNEDIEVKPSVFALWQAAGDIMLDYSAKFYLQERAWFGLTYRDIKSGIASAGFHINEQFSVAYSFEFSLGELRTFTGSSHDVVISWRVKNLKRANQYTW